MSFVRPKGVRIRSVLACAAETLMSDPLGLTFCLGWG
jgi:hypothetical protein